MGIGSAIRVISAFHRDHPLRKKKGVQIDYNITSVIMPACIIGVNFGIIVNTITPEPIVLGTLIIALIYLSISTGMKWWSVRTRENKVTAIAQHKSEALKNAEDLSSVSSI